MRLDFCDRTAVVLAFIVTVMMRIAKTKATALVEYSIAIETDGVGVQEQDKDYEKESKCPAALVGCMGCVCERRTPNSINSQKGESPTHSLRKRGLSNEKDFMPKIFKSGIEQARRSTQ